MSFYTSFPLINKNKKLIRGAKAGMAPCFAEQQPCRLDRLPNARPYYNKAMDSIYTRFTECEWNEHNRYMKCVADTEVGIAQKVKTCSWEAVSVARERTHNRKMDNKIKLARRIKNVDDLRQIEVEERDKLENVINQLKETRNEVLKILEDLRIALAIAEETMMRRQNRVSMLQVLDNVEKGLTQEISQLRNSRVVLLDFFDCINNQITKDRDAQLALVANIRDKAAAEVADIKAYKLDVCSPEIKYQGYIENHAPTVTDESTWLEFGMDILERAERERLTSYRLIETVHRTMQRERSLIFSYNQHIANSVKCRVQDMKQAQLDLETSLKKIDFEISELERTAKLLNCSIEDKILHLKLVETKISERTNRFCVENTRDKPYIGFKAEAQELRDTINSLREKLDCVELSLCRLNNARLAHIADIRATHCNIQIDSKCVLPLHQTLHPSVPFNEAKKRLCAYNYA